MYRWLEKNAPCACESALAFSRCNSRPIERRNSSRHCLIALILSLSMWALITLVYLETVHAFDASPLLAGMSLVKCILLLAAET